MKKKYKLPTITSIVNFQIDRTIIEDNQSLFNLIINIYQFIYANSSIQKSLLRSIYHDENKKNKNIKNIFNFIYIYINTFIV